MFAGGSLVADAREVKITHGVQRGGFEVQTLLAGA